MITLRKGGARRAAGQVIADLELPEAVFKTCPWQPRELVETGLRQWFRCCAVALRDGQVIGMPSRAVDEAWHGLILCTARYAAFCDAAYGQFLHHHPDGGAPPGAAATGECMNEQLRRTVIAWSMIAGPGERCVLWDLDSLLGLDEPWGVSAQRVAEIEAALTGRRGAESGMTARNYPDAARRTSTSPDINSKLSPT
ncbi:glycine-rich domain-containing protein [Mycolicibacterium peregrinum]|uniref:glycine-rich domain-containing protein n=1 Tax=Mycolicibacterium peregrinum TaxID=43304 RepID=UPI0020B7253A|nr:hypothetical protein [Mycolicibacterium peregrinum]